MEQDSVYLSAESLSEAIEKIRIMRDVGVLEAAPSVVLGTAAQAAALVGTSSSNLVFSAGGTTNEAMRIGANGNVGIGTASSSVAPLKVHGRPVEVKPFEVSPDMAMLEDASSPYNVDVETLANLWVARFGKGWVGNDAVEDMDADQVDWWRHAANRLRELGYLEMHTLASSYRVVLRIVE